MTRNEELRALALRFVESLPDEIDEALLTGSVSRGEADELSDVEMLLVVRGTPLRLSALGIEMWQEDFFENGTVAWYTALVEGEVLEMAGWTHARVEGRVDGILSGEMIDHTRFRFAEALVHGIPLRSAGAIERWQARLAEYPEALVESIVHDASEEWLEHPLGVRAHVRPGGRLSLAAMLADDLQNVLRIVFALNRVWSRAGSACHSSSRRSPSSRSGLPSGSTRPWPRRRSGRHASSCSTRFCSRRICLASCSPASAQHGCSGSSRDGAARARRRFSSVRAQRFDPRAEAVGELRQEEYESDDPAEVAATVHNVLDGEEPDGPRASRTASSRSTRNGTR